MSTFLLGMLGGILSGTICLGLTLLYTRRELRKIPPVRLRPPPGRTVTVNVEADTTQFVEGMRRAGKAARELDRHMRRRAWRARLRRWLRIGGAS